MRPTMCHIRATIQFCPGRELRKKKTFSFFSEWHAACIYVFRKPILAHAHSRRRNRAECDIEAL